MTEQKLQKLTRKDLEIDTQVVMPLGIGTTIPPILKDPSGRVIWKKRGNTANTPEQNLKIGISNILGMFLTSDSEFNEVYPRNEQGLIPEDLREAASKYISAKFDTQQKFIAVFGRTPHTKIPYFEKDYHEVLERSFAVWGLKIEFDQQKTTETVEKQGIRRGQTQSQELSTREQWLHAQLQAYLEVFEEGRHITFEQYLKETNGQQDIDLIGLQKRELEGVQETDFPLSVIEFTVNFIGSAQKNRAISNIVRDEHPELFAQRVHGRQTILVCTDRNIFINSMTAHGAKLRDRTLLEVQETDFQITQNEITNLFKGDSNKLKRVTQDVLDRLITEDANLVVQRQGTTQIITVVTNRQRFIDEMINQGVPLKDNELQEPKETDFLINTVTLTATFRGGQSKLFEIAREVKEALLGENPGFFVQRKQHAGFILDVPVDKNRFIAEMIARGAELKSFQKVQEDDFILTKNSLTSIFVGGFEKISYITQLVIAKLRAERPEIFAQRIYGTNLVDVTTDRQIFIDEMMLQGLLLKDESTKDVQETDFPITQTSLQATFIGGYKKLIPIAQEVLQIMGNEEDNFVDQRRSGRSLITVVTNKQRFIAEMVARGIELHREGLQSILETDVPITNQALEQIFYGDIPKVKPIAQEVLEYLRQDASQLIVQRVSGNHIVEVVTDKDRFIQEMLIRGAQLRDNSLQELQETDFPVSKTALLSIFIGAELKLKGIAHQVLDKLKQENSALVAQRKSQSSIVDVVTNKERFIQAMLAQGAKLRNPDIQEVQETDYVINQMNLTKDFVGSQITLNATAREVVAYLEENSPGTVFERKRETVIVPVVTDKGLFIQEMQARGAEIRSIDIQELQETDFAITKTNLTSIFVGEYRKLSKISQVVLGTLHSEILDIITQRRNRGQIISVVTDRNRFIQEMIVKGAKLKRGNE